MCKGDYGSALFYFDPHDYHRATLVGINVFPYLHHNCEDHKFSIFTYIPRRIEWIKKVLGEESKFCIKPNPCGCTADSNDPYRKGNKITF